MSKIIASVFVRTSIYNYIQVRTSLHKATLVYCSLHKATLVYCRTGLDSDGNVSVFFKIIMK